MKKWNIKNNAGLRPALFFEVAGFTLNELEEDIDKYSNLFLNVESVKSTIMHNIYSLIDSFFTPFVIREIVLQKDRLCGKNSKERYASFFLTSKQKWQPGALLIENKYRSQILYIKKLIEYESSYLCSFLYHFASDIRELKKNFLYLIA